jgi:hypothetical protein
MSSTHGKDSCGPSNGLLGWVQRVCIAGESATTSLALLLIGVLVIALRRPLLWTQPRFWEEEGYVYFAEAWNSGSAAVLLKIYAGYIDLSANIPAALAASISLELAPLITTLCALVFQSIPVAIIAFSRAEFWRTPLRKLTGIALIIMVPMTSEIWLNTTTSKVHLTLAVALLLLEAKAAYGWGRQLAYAALAFLSGLSSPMPCFLLPFALLGAYRTRTRLAVSVAAGLLLATVLQGVLMVSFPSNRNVSERLRTAIPAVQIPALASRCVVLPFAGSQAAYQAGNLMIKASPARNNPVPWLGINAASIALIAGLGILLYRNRTEHTAILAGAAAWLAVLSQLTGTAQVEEFMLFPLWNIRYYYASISLLLIALLEQAQARSRHWMSLVLVCLALLHGTWSYRSFHWRNDAWPKWKDEVAKWRQDPSRPLQVWPPGKPLRLNPRKSLVRDSQSMDNPAGSAPEAR